MSGTVRPLPQYLLSVVRENSSVTLRSLTQSLNQFKVYRCNRWAMEPGQLSHHSD